MIQIWTKEQDSNLEKKLDALLEKQKQAEELEIALQLDIKFLKEIRDYSFKLQAIANVRPELFNF